MTIKEILSRPKQFQYMMLGRLEHDLNYAKFCGRKDGGTQLWGGDLKTHREYMSALYSALNTKPSEVFIEFSTN